MRKTILSQKKLSKKTSYATALAWSLIEYAKKNQAFAAALKEKISFLEKTDLQPETAIKNNSFFLLEPKDEFSALKRADWLISKISQNEWPATKESRAVLQSQKMEQPKQIIVGIAATSIPGITLGKIQTKNCMAFLINNDFLKKTNNLNIGYKISQTCLDFFQNELKKANNKIAKIEPETADWFFGEKKISFYAANNFELEKIKKELDDLDIAYSLVTQKNQIALVAISPSLNNEHAANHWDITPLYADNFIG